MRVLHELLAEGTRVRRHGRAEHHHLLLLRRLDEDLLDVLAHVELVQALVALVQDELRELVELQVLLARQAEHAARGANEDMRAIVLQHLLILGYRHTAVHHACLHVLEVLGEPVELMLDLIGQLTRVAHHQDLHALLRWVNLLKARQHEDRCLAHAGLGLAQNVGAQDCLWDTLMLHLRGMLEAAVYNGTEQLGLQEEVTKARSVDGGIAALLLVISILDLLLGLL
mmetsp:Transcript_9687/g.26196  ORF Transcript_9687/g.26196 Transcript_9687/m.26196 type:complete len:227 (-) Transcript_9687:109-789(-)